MGMIGISPIRRSGNLVKLYEYNGTEPKQLTELNCQGYSVILVSFADNATENSAGCFQIFVPDFRYRIVTSSPNANRRCRIMFYNDVLRQDLQGIYNIYDQDPTPSIGIMIIRHVFGVEGFKL